MRTRIFSTMYKLQHASVRIKITLIFKIENELSVERHFLDPIVMRRRIARRIFGEESYLHIVVFYVKQFNFNGRRKRVILHSQNDSF